MYSPKIAEDLIPKLYRRAKEEKKRMTKLVNEIIRENMQRYEKHKEEYENMSVSSNEYFQ